VGGCQCRETPDAWGTGSLLGSRQRPEEITLNAPRFAPAALCTALFLLCAGPASADPGPRTPTWVPDGDVKSVAISGSTAYLGGTFDWVAPYSGGSVSVDPESADRRSAWPDVSGRVFTAVPDGGGGWYLGGRFTAVGGVARRNLAHVLADGQVDAAWAPSADDAVFVLQAYDDTVYVGGRFTKIGSVARLHFAALAGTKAAVTTFAPSVNGYVRALAIGGTLSDPVLYLGGGFSMAAGLPRRGLASFKIVGGTLTPFDANISGIVYDVEVGSNGVYAAGDITKANGIFDRKGVANFDPTTGEVAGFDPKLQGSSPEVADIEIAGGTVYLVGHFATANAGTPTEAARHNAAAFKVGSNAVTAWDPRLDHEAYSVDVRGNTAYIGGEFSSVNGSLPRCGAAAVTADSGAALPWAAMPHGVVREIAVGGSDVIVGGEFDTYGGVPRQNLAAIDLRSGEPTAFRADVDNTVLALAVGPSGVWAGGRFTNAGSVPRSHLANFDPLSGQVGEFSQALDNSVRALAVDGRTVYASGGFTMVGTTSRPYVAAFKEAEGTPGALLPFNPQADATVGALALSAGKVFLGGDFTTLNGGIPRHYVGAVDPVTGVATSWDADVEQSVSDLTPVGSNRIVAAGSFGMVNGATKRLGLAMFDTDTAVATGWDAGLGFVAYAVASDGEQVFAGGVVQLEGGSRTTLESFDTVSGTLSSWRSGVPALETPAVYEIDATPNGWVVAAGDFTIDRGPDHTARLAVYPLPPPGQPDPGSVDPGAHADDPGAHPHQPTTDRTAPVLRGLRASPKRFRARRGTKLSFTLSERARVAFEVRKARGGRRVRRFSRSASTGAGRVKLTGKVGNRRLMPGRYVLRATPTDAGGNVGAARSVRLRVLPVRRSG
jgi:hypothetical protein